MWADLQTLVDDIAARLGAPAVVEDEQQRVVVYSSHSSPIDEVRRDSILRRTTRPAVRDWFREYGIVHATEPIRIPGDTELGVLGRLCVPVRYQHRLAGFLWFIDDEQRLGPTELAEARRAARHAGLLMYEDHLAEQLEGTLLAHLLSPSEELRAMAAEQILDERAPGGDTVWTVAVVRHGELATDSTAEHVRSLVRHALRDIARQHPRGCVLTMVSPDHSVLLYAAPRGEAASQAHRLACDVRDAVVDRLERAALSTHAVVVGVGDHRPLPDDAYASAREARFAARVAARIDEVGQVATWANLGVYRALIQLPGGENNASSLDPRLVRLLAEADSSAVDTIETYLDHGCDAQATAALLHLHRGTLYYRLKRAHNEFGIDLRRGDDRLTVHVGLKLARLTGLRG